jgi:hypothetical protein
MATNTINFSYISSIELMQEPDFLVDVLDVNPDEMTVLDIMDILPGRKEVTKNPLYQAKFAKSVLKKGTQVGAADGTKNGATPGTNLLVTIDSALNLPSLGDIASYGIPTATLDKQGIVVAITPATPSMEIQPFESTSTIGQSVATDEFVYVGSAHKEGSAAPDGQRPEWTDTSNRIQIFKDADTITELQDGSVMKFHHNGSPRALYKMQTDLLLRHRAKIAAGLMVGLQSDAEDADEFKTYTTQGLYNYIIGGDGKKLTTGGVVTSLGGTATTLAKLKATSRALDKKGSPKSYMVYAGGDWKADFEDEVRTLTGVAAGGIRWDMWGSSDPKKRAADLGVDVFRVYGRTLNVKDVSAFDKEEQFASKGYADLAGTAMYIPNSEVKINHGKRSVQRMRLRHMQGVGGDYIHSENTTGRLAPNPTDTTATLKIDYMTIIGLECLGIEQFAMQTKA